MRHCVVLLLASASMLLFGGCQTGEVKAVVPIAGGGQITVPLTPSGPPPGEAEGYKIATAGLQPGTEARDAFYQFAIVSAKPAKLSRIVIEDISDEQPVTLIDDSQPQFAAGKWSAQTPPIPAEDPRLKWVMQITASLRVYRVTLTPPEGKPISFNHIASYPPFYKAAIRGRWGEKY